MSDFDQAKATNDHVREWRENALAFSSKANENSIKWDLEKGKNGKGLLTRVVCDEINLLYQFAVKYNLNDLENE